jgi:hypothetical protein
MLAVWDLLGEVAELQAKRLSKNTVDVGTPVAQKGKGTLVGVITFPRGGRGALQSHPPQIHSTRFFSLRQTPLPKVLMCL